MHTSYTQFKIDQLRHDKLLFVLESIAIVVLAFFVNVFLPSLLFQYVYADMALTEEPAALQAIPVVTFSIAILYCIYAFITNMMRASKIKKLEKELVLEMSMNDGCCGGDCHCGHDHDHNDEMMIDMTPAVSTKKRSSKK